MKLAVMARSKPTSTGNATKRATARTRKPAGAKTTAKARKQPPKNPLMKNGHDWDRQAVMDVVCSAIASSTKSITSILEAGHEGHSLPTYGVLARWLAEEDKDGHNIYREQYARAKEAQADLMAEEIAELHEKAWVPIIDPETGQVVRDADGRVLRYVDKSSVAAVRLEADNKKWLMGKLKPKRYGEKVTQEHTGVDGGPIQARIGIEFVNPPARAEDQDA